MKVLGGILLVLVGGVLVLNCVMSALSLYGPTEVDTWWKVAGAVGAVEGLSAVAAGIWLLTTCIGGKHTQLAIDGNRRPVK
jgi:hypothetical protein